MALPTDDYGGTPIPSGGGYPPPAHVVAGTYYDKNWNEVNADGSPLGSKSTGVTYWQVVDTDGSLSGVPGATVQVSSTGSVSIISRPSSGGGGGGGAVSQAGRYSTHVDTTGAITGIPGATYQEDSFDGSITIVNRPSATTGSFSNPLDRNNDGLNDSTGWANGVFKDSSSPSGFYYASGGQYIPVTPDGAPYNGPDLSGGGASNAKTWTGQGPKGYGTYYLDGAGGTPGTFIGDTRAPSSSSAAVSGSSASGGSGGGSSASSAIETATINAAAKAASDAAQAAQQAAHDAWQGNQNDAQRNWQAAQNAIDRALKLTSDRANFELQRTGLINDQTKMLLDGARQFADLVSSTDPIKYRAFLEAGGGDIWNGLFNGGTAVSDNANLGAARTLRAMENPTHIPTWDEMMAKGGLDVLNPPTVGAGGVGNTPATGTGIGYGNDAQGTNVGGGTATGTTTGSGSGGVANAAPAFNPGLPVATSYSGELPPVSGFVDPTMENRMPGAFGNFDLGPLAGVPLTAQQRNDYANAAYGNWVTDSSAAGALNFNNYTPYVTQAQATGITGAPPPAPPQETFVSRFARGGVMVGGGMAVTGDSHTGRPNEEMVINLNPDPRDRIAVVPMDRIRQMGMGPAVRSVINRGGVQVATSAGRGEMLDRTGRPIPYAADGGIFGTDSYLNPITPEDQPYLDRVQAIRDATDFSNWNPFRADYFQNDPTIRDANEKAVQAARGIPQASLAAYAQRYALPGIQRGALRIGA